MNVDQAKAKPSQKTPYEEGAAALDEGKNFTHNPYEEGTPEHRAWYCGWRDVEEQR